MTGAAEEEAPAVVTSREPPPVERFRPADLDRDWSALRSTCPVTQVTTPAGANVWLVSRYTDVRMILNSKQFSVSPVAPEGSSTEVERNDSIFQDPPAHTRLRGLVSRAFTPARVARYRAAIESAATGLVDDMPATQSFDLMEQFANPLTMNVIAEVVGVPPADRRMFRELSDQLLVPVSEAAGAAAFEGWRHLNDYVLELIAHRRRTAGRGRHDLVEDLLTAQAEDATLSDVELTTMVLGLPVAGYVSTANAIAVGVRQLATGWLHELRAAPDLADPFVEEVLRFQSGDNGESMPRFALVDVSVQDQRIRCGDTVVAPLVAANRDDAVFDRPDMFDPRRASLNYHLAFGIGIHRCLGANLARLELQCAVAALVASDVELALAEDWETVRWKTNMLGDRFPERLMIKTRGAGR